MDALFEAMLESPHVLVQGLRLLTVAIEAEIEGVLTIEG
jgi:hypothetical protein